MTALLVYGLPIGAIIVGARACLFTLREVRLFDRKYGADAPYSNVFDTKHHHA